MPSTAYQAPPSPEDTGDRMEGAWARFSDVDETPRLARDLYYRERGEQVPAQGGKHRAS